MKVVGREEQRAPSVGEWIERKEECDEKDSNHTLHLVSTFRRVERWIIVYGMIHFVEEP